MASLGVVVTTCTAKLVVGLEAGLQFSAFVKAKVLVVGLPRVGVPGALAEV